MEKLFPTETETRLESYGFDLKKLAALDIEKFESARREFSTLICPRIRDATIKRELGNRGVVLEELKPGSVIRYKEDERLFHGVVVHTDSYYLRQLLVMAWFPLASKLDCSGSTFKINVRDIIKVESDLVAMEANGTRPALTVRHSLQQAWKDELLSAEEEVQD